MAKGRFSFERFETSSPSCGSLQAKKALPRKGKENGKTSRNKL